MIHYFQSPLPYCFSVFVEACLLFVEASDVNQMQAAEYIDVRRLKLNTKHFESTAYHLMKPWSLNSFKQYRDQTFGITEAERRERPVSNVADFCELIALNSTQQKEVKIE